MTQQDLSRVESVGAMVHQDYPEDAAVMAERLQFYPAGCLVLDSEGGVAGYAIGHPWTFGNPPALNTLLHSLPPRADTFYIHDVALMPDMRGIGLAEKVIELLAQQANTERLESITLVAVNAARRFWSKHGFEVVQQDAVRAKLASYGAAAVYMTRRLR
jgi:GNAT superfamily N-acetyltransferase